MAGRVLERSLADMTLPQFRVLSVIASSPERANRLAEKAAMSRPSLTGLLDGLETRGWVQRVHVEEDRRGVSLEVTQSGAQALREAEQAMTAELERVLASAPDDRPVVIDGLTALGDAIREHHRALR
jgi:DNA-binding MarR family transcriptional regulator